MDRRRRLALLYGLACHSLFLGAISLMAMNLFTGMRSNFGPLQGAAAAVADLALVVQFPVLHSFLLTQRGRRWLGQLAPDDVAADLGTTLFAAVASLQLILAFGLWSPLGGAVWAPEGALGWALTASFAASWLLLGKAMWDAGLALQTGALGWMAVYRERRPRFGGFPEGGLFAVCRQPIYLAFTMILWTAPVMTVDRFVLAAAWTLYCVIGPKLKEARFFSRYGEAFARYQGRVPYFVPRPLLWLWGRRAAAAAEQVSAKG